MTERSLFNVVGKISGLWMFLNGISSLVWAFIASRFSQRIPFDPTESSSWFTGGVFTFVGLVLMTRSSAITRFLFRLDGALDEPVDTSVVGDEPTA